VLPGEPSGDDGGTAALLSRALFARPAVEVAPDLLGCALEHEAAVGLVAVELTEVEAYAGETDPAVASPAGVPGGRPPWLVPRAVPGRRPVASPAPTGYPLGAGRWHHAGVDDIIDELSWRGLLAVTTDLDELRGALNSGRVTVYCGFDPTAPGLHIGHLLQLLTLRRLQLAGHQPIGVVGGATGLIGDPSGKSAERVLNPRDVVAEWVERIRGEVSRFLVFDAGPSSALIVSNLDWTGPMHVLEFLRDIGKHFSVNRMLDRESVKARLEGGGISYTEFSYQLLQALDFLELYRRNGCTAQLGGSDQWGNLVAGVHLIRSVEGASVHALATPLITKPDGTKYGKTEGGAIWLSGDLMSPYAFYQFWLNVSDAEVPTLLKVFSFRSREEIEALIRESVERPAARVGQRALAEEITTLVHGADECRRAVAASQALFGHGEPAELDERTWAAVTEEVPHVAVPRSNLRPNSASQGGLTLAIPQHTGSADRRVSADPQGGAASTSVNGPPSIASLMVSAGTAPTFSAARRAIAEGGVYLNNQRVTSVDQALTPADLVHDRYALVRRGKRTVAVVEVVDGQ
jgi:tyrosyl-tRNA synthetase